MAKQNKNVVSVQKKSHDNLFSILRKYKDDYLFMLPFYTVFFLFSILPVLISIFFSFTYFNVVETPHFIGLDNYFKLFLEDDLFVKALSTTVVLAVITGPVSYILCFAVAWMVNEFNRQLRAFLTLLFYMPTLTGGLSAIWLIIFSGDQYGTANGLLMALNFIHEPIQWLSDTKYMMGVAIVVIIWMSLGTSFLSFIAGFRSIDTSMYEAGAIDGIRNRFQELWYITLPAMKPQLMFGAIMCITSSFGVGTVISQIFGFPSTAYRLYTLVHMLEDYGGQRFEMGYASAVATILFIIMVVINKFVQGLIAKVGK